MWLKTSKHVDVSLNFSGEYSSVINRLPQKLVWQEESQLSALRNFLGAQEEKNPYMVQIATWVQFVNRVECLGIVLCQPIFMSSTPLGPCCCLTSTGNLYERKSKLLNDIIERVVIQKCSGSSLDYGFSDKKSCYCISKAQSSWAAYSLKNSGCLNCSFLEYPIKNPLGFLVLFDSDRTLKAAR